MNQGTLNSCEIDDSFLQLIDALGDTDYSFCFSVDHFFFDLSILDVLKNCRGCALFDSNRLVLILVRMSCHTELGQFFKHIMIVI